MVGAFRPKPDAGPVFQPKPPFLALLLWDLQPFASPLAIVLGPMADLMARRSTRLWFTHQPALFSRPVVHWSLGPMAQPRTTHPISVAPVLIGQFDDVVCQTRFTSTALRNFTLRGSVLTQSAAGTALRHAKLLPNVVDTFATTRRAQKGCAFRATNHPLDGLLDALHPLPPRSE